jgi:hypothetical protein
MTTTKPPVATPVPIADFRYDYTKYRSRAISVERLDQLADFVFSDPGQGMLSAIYSALKLAFALAYITARTIMIDKEQLISKQEYEAARDGHSQPDGTDNLDVRPRT